MAVNFVPPFKLNNSTDIVPRSAGITSIYGNNQGFQLSVGGTATATAQLDVLTGSSSRVGEIVKAAASQSADLAEWQDSSGNNLLLVNSLGFVNYLASNQTQSANFNVFSSTTTQTISASAVIKYFLASNVLLFTATQGFGAQSYMFHHSTAYKNSPSLTGAIGFLHTSFRNQPTFTGDTNATQLLVGQGFSDNPTFNIANSGTLAVTSWVGYTAGGTSGSGVTITTRIGLEVDNITGGTIGTHIGLLINDLANAGSTTTQALRVLGTTAHSRHVPTIRFGADSAPTYQLDVMNGALGIGTVGNTLRIKEGTNACMGTTTLVGGASTVSTTAVTANSRIFITINAPGGTAGFLRISARTAGTSFTITSSNVLDTSVVDWIMFEPF